MSSLLWLTLLGLPAAAEEGEQTAASEDAEPAEEEEQRREKRWGGLIIPLVGATSTDGFGLGLGGELFRRPADGSPGYDLKITPSLYFNLRLDYTNDLIRIDWRAPGGTAWLVQVGYQAWRNLSYAGVGGEDVILDRGTQEVGNRFSGPYGQISATHPVGERGWSAIGQVTFRGGQSTPAPGGLMDAYDPLAADGGLYVDIGAGVANTHVDRWPMPTRGHSAALVGTAGLTFAERAVHPLLGAQVETMAWQPLIPDRLVLSGRVLVHKTVGERPFFDQDKAGGRWRDELGSEQALAGYGRTRTRGDGVVAGLVELRPHLFHIDKPWLDLAFHLSLTAEMGWLYTKSDPGPPLPTVGFGVPLLYSGVVQLRPFLAWGWRREDPTDPRRPSMQVGISVLDAL